MVEHIRVHIAASLTTQHVCVVNTLDTEKYFQEAGHPVRDRSTPEDIKRFIALGPKYTIHFVPSEEDNTS